MHRRLLCFPFIVQMPLSEEQVIQSARDTINRAKEKQHSSLHLYGMRLKELPSEVLEMADDSLTSLNLGGNKFTTLPPQLKSKQSKITKLTLSANPLLKQQEIHDLVSALSLQEFIFSQNEEIRAIPLLESLEKSIDTLQELDLGDLPMGEKAEMTRVVSELSRFTHLKRLDLTSVQWTEFPVGLTALSNLQDLNLSYNRIRILPHEAGKFESLAWLTLDGCRLEKIEEGFCQLKTLKRLSLSYNELSALPENFNQLESLELLFVLYNNFKEVPNALTEPSKRPPSLKGANLNGNLIEELIQDSEENVQSLPYDHVQTPSLILEQERQGNETLYELYLGCANSARNKHYLRSKNIKSILIVGCGLNQLYQEFTYHQCLLDDDESENIAQYFDEGTQFIHAQRKKGGVLVHCAAGISRSASLVIAYLIRYHNMKYDQAFNFVRQQRDIICPNRAFVEQLQNYTPRGKECTLS